jgi:putative FmdB family regulatory protein
MPLYEYRCDACEHEFEALQRMSDDALTECPECHKDALRKLVSAAGFRLAGDGWYETDFKTGSKKNLVESGSKPAKKTNAAACGTGCGCH